jgi:Protein of unknown function (DUF4054)
MSDATTQVVTFDYTAWALLFPSLAPSVNVEQATMYFGLAELYLDNGPCSQIVIRADQIPRRALILNLLTAHVATLFGSINGQSPNPLVGRISQATEGSVSVAVDFPENPNAAWFNQTPYGAAAWQAMAPWRTALYIAAPQVPLAAQSWPGVGGWGIGSFGGLPFNGGFPWPR